MVGSSRSLTQLDLSYNLLYVPIPTDLGLLQNLTDLGSGGNNLNGTLPDNLGQLSKLYYFDVSFNQTTGMVNETHFLKQHGLKYLHLSSNSLIWNVSSNRVPPFQASSLDIGSSHLGPLFPTWLRSQKEVMYLDFSNGSISDFVPYWFWDKISPKLSLLNVSFNRLKGHLPSPLKISPFADVDLSFNLFEGPIPLPIVEVLSLHLSNNKLSGPLPQNVSYSLQNLVFFSLSGNQIIREIPTSFGDSRSLDVINLSSNNVSGKIPASIGNCPYLKALDLSNNNLSGNIPVCLGQLHFLRTLHLGNNKLSGRIPFSLKSLSSLETLDLGNNKLRGRLPQWIGKEGLVNLKILSLRSNSFFGELPSSLSNLRSLHVLDLAENLFKGSIPASFKDFKAMTQLQRVNQYLFYGVHKRVYYDENLVVNTRGRSLTYTKTLSLLTSLDLSGNNLGGDIPEEITKLLGLVVLNLSQNHISGDIAIGISNIGQLLSLDLSSNKLWGPIPVSLSSLSFLGHLNLSNNLFSGMIPDTGHMTTFDASSFSGNPELCGAPLAVKCPDGDNDDDDLIKEPVVIDSHGDDTFIDEWFYLSVGLGFAARLLVPYLVFAIRRSWRDAYFFAFWAVS